MRQGGHWRLGLILYYDWLWSLTEKFPGYYFLSRSLVACRICLQGLRTFPAMSESFKILSVVSASRERAVLRRCVGMWSNWHVEALVEEIRAVISDILVNVNDSRYATGRLKLSATIQLDLMWSGGCLFDLYTFNFLLQNITKSLLFRVTGKEWVILFLFC